MREIRIVDVDAWRSLITYRPPVVEPEEDDLWIAECTAYREREARKEQYLQEERDRVRREEEQRRQQEAAELDAMNAQSKIDAEIHEEFERLLWTVLYAPDVSADDCCPFFL